MNSSSNNNVIKFRENVRWGPRIKFALMQVPKSHGGEPCIAAYQNNFLNLSRYNLFANWTRRFEWFQSTIVLCYLVVLNVFFSCSIKAMWIDSTWTRNTKSMWNWMTMSTWTFRKENVGRDCSPTWKATPLLATSGAHIEYK